MSHTLHDINPAIFGIKKLRDYVILPVKAHEGDAGFDVFCHESFSLSPKRSCRVPLGFALDLGKGWVALIQERSGLAWKNGVFTIGNVIDSSYRGECHAIIYNGGEDPVNVVPGTRIAQMLIIPCYTGVRYDVVVKMADSERGEGGFGSTGGA